MSEFSGIVSQASKKYGVSSELINAVIQQESSGNPSAVSSAGAVGLMQLMPGTAAELGVTDRTDPEQNIMGGTKYLSQLIDRYDGDEEAALAAYYAGSGNVDKYGKEKYSNYYEGVFSKMDTSGGTSGGTTNAGFFSGSGLTWWGNIVLIVVILGCVGLGIAFTYFAVNNIV